MIQRPNILQSFSIKNMSRRAKASKLRQLSNISTISPRDQELLKKTVQRFRPNSDNYEDSWGYVIQSTRYGGFKWYDNKTGYLIFMGKKSSTSSTIVVTSFFATIEYLGIVLNKLLKDNKDIDKIIIKNVDPDIINDFKNSGFREYYPNEKWSKEARFDDQTYPQLIANLEVLANPRGKSFHQLRRILNKKQNIILREYKESDRDDVSMILAQKDSHSVIGDEKGMYYSAHAMYLSANLDKYVIVKNTSGEILGFTATSDISEKNTTLVASIFKPGVKVASVWGIYQTLMKKYKQGFKYINLGGLETEGSYTFLNRTFRPVKRIKRTHLVFDAFETKYASI